MLACLHLLLPLYSIFYYTSSVSFLFCLHCLLLDSSTFLCLILFFFCSFGNYNDNVYLVFFSVVSFYLEIFFFAINHYECVFHSLSKVIILVCVYFLCFFHIDIICIFPSASLFGKVHIRSVVAWY